MSYIISKYHYKCKQNFKLFNIVTERFQSQQNNKTNNKAFQCHFIPFLYGSILAPFLFLSSFNIQNHAIIGRTDVFWQFST